jgi:dTDP-4-dehydrorhamnose reductase
MIGKKILITGPSGVLGSSFLKHPYNENTYGIDVDITHRINLQKRLVIEKPDVIIHTAAYTDVENSEIDKDRAYKVNTLGTFNLVSYCIGKDVLFVYISSTGVYGETKLLDPYNEFDNAMPTSTHHKSKYQGENVVTNHLNKYLIIRTGWLFGGTISNKKNFVYKRYLEACDNYSIYSDIFQIGNPTYVNNLVKQIFVLINENQYGTFNCVDKANNVSRYDYVKKIVELFDLTCKINKSDANFFKRIAPVSRNESATNYKLNLLGLNVMEDWEKSLYKYVRLLKREING